MPAAVPRFWELSPFEGGEHRDRPSGVAGGSAPGPTGAEYCVGEPLTEWQLCPTLLDSKPPPAMWICAHCTHLHPELRTGTVPGCEGTYSDNDLQSSLSLACVVCYGVGVGVILEGWPLQFHGRSTVWDKTP